MDRFDEVRRLRDEYEGALDEVERKRAEYHRSIQKLHLSGMPLREIAEGLGISHQRVHQIVSGEPPTHTKRRRVARGIVAASVSLAVGAAGFLTGRTVGTGNSVEATSGNKRPDVLHCASGQISVTSSGAALSTVLSGGPGVVYTVQSLSIDGTAIGFGPPLPVVYNARTGEVLQRGGPVLLVKCGASSPSYSGGLPSAGN